jgi:hypothetical protein
MIRVSEIASQAILGALQASGAGPDKGLRLKRQDIGLSLCVDTPQDNDHVIWHDNSMVLMVDHATEKRSGMLWWILSKGQKVPG